MTVLSLVRILCSYWSSGFPTLYQAVMGQCYDLGISLGGAGYLGENLSAFSPTVQLVLGAGGDSPVFPQFASYHQSIHNLYPSLLN